MLSCEHVLGQDAVAPLGHERAASGTIAFDIPSQPLDVALRQFNTAAGIELFYESSVVRGRTSVAVSGRLPAEVALQILLQGTGLFSTSSIAARSRSCGRTTRPRRPASPARGPKWSSSSRISRLQQTMDRALCGRAFASRDPRDRLVRLWIAPSGRVARVELLPTTGSEQHDGAYLAALAAVAVDTPPPAAMPQPVNMMIGADTSRDVGGCSRINAARSSAQTESLK